MEKKIYKTANVITNVKWAPTTTTTAILYAYVKSWSIYVTIFFSLSLSVVLAYDERKIPAGHKRPLKKQDEKG